MLRLYSVHCLVFSLLLCTISQLFSKRAKQSHSLKTMIINQTSDITLTIIIGTKHNWQKYFWQHMAPFADGIVLNRTIAQSVTLNDSWLPILWNFLNYCNTVVLIVSNRGYHSTNRLGCDMTMKYNNWGQKIVVYIAFSLFSSFIFFHTFFIVLIWVNSYSSYLSCCVPFDFEEIKTYFNLAPVYVRFVWNRLIASCSVNLSPVLREIILFCYLWAWDIFHS